MCVNKKCFTVKKKKTLPCMYGCCDVQNATWSERNMPQKGAYNITCVYVLLASSSCSFFIH